MYFEKFLHKPFQSTLRTASRSPKNIVNSALITDQLKEIIRIYAVLSIWTDDIKQYSNGILHDLDTV